MTERIIKAKEFLEAKLLSGYDKFFMTEEQMAYRYEHSLRVARLGQIIARAENMDEEALIVACLLHDVGYCLIESEEGYDGHGWLSERVSRPFVYGLDFDGQTSENILAGISAHVGGEANFECEQNAFTESISDCDNIDRFDAFRIYDTLHAGNFRDLPLVRQKTTVAKRIKRLAELREMKLATKTAKALWREKIDFQILFYSRLESQLMTALE